MKHSKEDKLKTKLRKVVAGFLDANVKTPAIETVNQDFSAQARLADLMLLVSMLNDLIYKHGAGFDKEYACHLSENEISRKIAILGEVIESEDSNELQQRVSIEEVRAIFSEFCSRKCLLTYLAREVKWIAISIFSASYVSSMILMRATFELIVGIASRDTDGMVSRIASISFIDESEKDTLKKVWYRLCAWGHPYGKWLKDICPIYSAHEPIYHKALCNMCIEELEKIVDFYVVVALAKYEIKLPVFVAMLKKYQLDITGLDLITKRLED
ncbi:MAG: hypothetical protein ACYTEL_26960 [Planctomycetota bacterium]|jgi:hypothetical protein